MNDTAERRYAMTRLAPGDYLLPSNDGQVLWRIQRYTEDGTLVRADDTQIVGTFWRVLRRPMPPKDAKLNEDWLLLEQWEEHYPLLDTRAEALAEIAKAEGR